MKLNCQSVSTSEAGDEIFQILFNEEIYHDDGPYLLLQRAFLEEDDGDTVFMLGYRFMKYRDDCWYITMYVFSFAREKQ